MSQSVKLKSFEGRAASIPLSSLRLLPELQVREKKEDPDHVEFLAEVINTKKLLPRVKVIYVESGDHVGHLVVDGCHTVRAYIKAGRKKVPCTVRSGTWEEAVYVAAGSNQEHRGLKLTNADKRRAVEMLLGTSYSKWGNEKIGEYIGVSGAFVAKIKDSAPEQTQHSDPRHHQTFNGDDGQNDVDENKKEGRDGKFYSPRRQARTASPRV